MRRGDSLFHHARGSGKLSTVNTQLLARINVLSYEHRASLSHYLLGVVIANAEANPNGDGARMLGMALGCLAAQRISQDRLHPAAAEVRAVVRAGGEVVP